MAARNAAGAAVTAAVRRGSAGGAAVARWHLGSVVAADALARPAAVATAVVARSGAVRARSAPCAAAAAAAAAFAGPQPARHSFVSVTRSAGAPPRVSVSPTVLRRVFDMFDSNADGLLGLKEFSRLVRLTTELTRGGESTVVELPPTLIESAFVQAVNDEGTLTRDGGEMVLSFAAFVTWVENGAPMAGLRDEPLSTEAVERMCARLLANFGMAAAVGGSATGGGDGNGVLPSLGESPLADSLSDAASATLAPVHLSDLAEAPLSPAGFPLDLRAEMVPSEDDPQTHEIKDSQLIFERVWEQVEAKFGREHLIFPKEIIWLMGAPGSGKSHNAGFVMKARDFEGAQIVVSDLLVGPEVDLYKRRGVMVPDAVVVKLLIEALLQPQFANGVLVDGFPRTSVQVECVYKLKERMKELRAEFAKTDRRMMFRRPRFRVAVLFVPERVSVARQMHRGREARVHNERVREQGYGELEPERETDFDENLARSRYRIFKEHYSTLQDMAKHFTFSVINANASVDKVRKAVLDEFQYQSAHELAEETLESVALIPQHTVITSHARQTLVRRLDNYVTHNRALFQRVVELVCRDIVPHLQFFALTGKAIVESDDELWLNTFALGMAVDALAERGFATAIRRREHTVPIRVDLTTGAIENKITVKTIFEVSFPKGKIRSEEQ